MAKFRFALEKVLGHRKTVENIAQRDFQEQLNLLAQLTEQMQLLEKSRKEAFEKRFHMQVQEGTNPEALTQVHDFLRGQDLRIARHQKKIQEQSIRVEEFRSILREKAIETKIIENLKERKQDDFRAVEKQKDQKRTDDLNTVRFRSKDATDEKNGV